MSTIKLFFQHFCCWKEIQNILIFKISGCSWFFVKFNFREKSETAQITKGGVYLESMSYFQNVQHMGVTRMVCMSAFCPRYEKSQAVKNGVNISWLHLDDQIETFEVGVIPGMSMFRLIWGSFKLI